MENEACEIVTENCDDHGDTSEAARSEIGIHENIENSQPAKKTMED
jgi:hypothetical protein